MSDFLTEKNKKAGVSGKTEMGSLWLLYTFVPWELLAPQRSILVKDAGEWQQRRLLLGLLFLYPTFREIQKTSKEETSQRNSLLV